VADDQQFQLNVQTQGTLTTPEQFRKIVLRANHGRLGAAVGDVARSRWGRRTRTPRRASTASRRSAWRSILRPTPIAVATAGRGHRTLERLSARFPEDLKARVVYDSTVFVTTRSRRCCGRSARLSSWS
jgi:HAE1 family hydrophobic/amphiphilic exporter-1